LAVFRFFAICCLWFARTRRGAAFCADNPCVTCKFQNIANVLRDYLGGIRSYNSFARATAAAKRASFGACCAKHFWNCSSTWSRRRFNARDYRRDTMHRFDLAALFVLPYRRAREAKAI
jgi:hypothetical protein